MIKIKKTFPTFWELMKYCKENKYGGKIKDLRMGNYLFKGEIADKNFIAGYNTIEIELDTNGYAPDKWHEWGMEMNFDSDLMMFYRYDGRVPNRNLCRFGSIRLDPNAYIYIPSDQSQTEYPEPPKKHETEFVGEPENTDLEKCWDIIKCDYVKHINCMPQKPNFRMLKEGIRDINDSSFYDLKKFLKYWQPSTLEEYKKSIIGGE